MKGKLRIIIIACAVTGGLAAVWLAAPQWFETPLQGNERRIRDILYLIHDVQEEYHSRHGVYGNMVDLTSDGLLNLDLLGDRLAFGEDVIGSAGLVRDCVITEGSRDGYDFKITACDYAWEARAEPSLPGKTGCHTFEINNEGSILCIPERFAEKNPDNWLSRFFTGGE